MGYKQCSVEGCVKNVVAKDLCDIHYRRQLHHGHLEQTRPADWGKRENHKMYGPWRWMFRGNKRVADEWSDFWRFVKDIGECPSERHKLWRLDETKPYGPNNFFWRESEIVRKSDETLAEYRNRHQKEWREKNPEKARAINLRKHYGIGLEEYEEMLAKQNGVCAICGRGESFTDSRSGNKYRLAVDHHHGTGKTRKLLCRACNTGIGCFKDDPAMLRKAAGYLEQHNL